MWILIETCFRISTDLIVLLFYMSQQQSNTILDDSLKSTPIMIKLA